MPAYSTRAGSNRTAGALFTTLFDQLGDQPGPARLMTRADTRPIVAMKIFVEQDQVLPMRIALKNFGATRYRTPSIAPSQENTNESTGNLRRHLP